jgi:hypothetical protein
MAKKSRTPKTPRVKGGKSGKSGQDAVTGLYWEVDGIGRLQSDKVYSISYEQAQKAIQPFLNQGYFNDSRPPEDYPIQLEIELSSNRMAISSIDAQGNKARDVLTGQLSFSKGRLSRFNIVESASFGIDGNGGYESGIIESFGSGRLLSNPNSFYSIYLDMANAGLQIGNYFSNGTTAEGNRSAFTTYGAGKFFGQGWENNLFNSNLI